MITLSSSSENLPGSLKRPLQRYTKPAVPCQGWNCCMLQLEYHSAIKLQPGSCTSHRTSASQERTSATPEKTKGNEHSISREQALSGSYNASSCNSQQRLYQNGRMFSRSSGLHSNVKVDPQIPTIYLWLFGVIPHFVTNISESRKRFARHLPMQ